MNGYTSLTSFSCFTRVHHSSSSAVLMEHSLTNLSSYLHVVFPSRIIVCASQSPPITSWPACQRRLRKWVRRTSTECKDLQQMFQCFEESWLSYLSFLLLLLFCHTIFWFYINCLFSFPICWVCQILPRQASMNAMRRIVPHLSPVIKCHTSSPSSQLFTVFSHLLGNGPAFIYLLRHIPTDKWTRRTVAENNKIIFFLHSGS